MKISELIEKLNSIKMNSGDIVVLIEKYNDPYSPTLEDVEELEVKSDPEVDGPFCQIRY